MHELFEIITAMRRDLKGLKPTLQCAATAIERDKVRKLAMQIEEQIVLMENRIAGLIYSANDP